MNPDDEVMVFMDSMHLDEQLIDSRLESIMLRAEYSTKQLAVALRMLQYKLYLNSREECDCFNENEYNFLVNIIRQVSEKNVDFVCKIMNTVLNLNKDSLVSKSEHLFQQILSNIDCSVYNLNGDCGGVDMPSEILLHLKLSESVLETVTQYGQKLNLIFFETPLENILFASNENLKKHFLARTVPVFTKAVAGYNILDRIWDCLKLIGSHYSCHLNNALHTLCSLTEFYLPSTDSPGKTKFKSNIVTNYEFWNLLLKGLKANNAFDRKMAVYLIKKSIDFVIALKKDVCVQIELETIFQWNHSDSNLLKQTWDNFFILMDSLEEKQSNIIMPSLKIYKMIETMESHWLNCALNIGLAHENLQVRITSILHRLEIPFRNEAEAITLLEALNDINLYDQSQYSNLQNVYNLLGKFMAEEENLIYMLKAITKIKWSPVPWYYVTKVLAIIYKPPVIRNKCLVQIILDMLNVPCNIKSIRTGIKVHILKFIKKCCPNLDTKDVIDVFSSNHWGSFLSNMHSSFDTYKDLPTVKMDTESDILFFCKSVSNCATLEYAHVYLMKNQRHVDLFKKSLDGKINKIKEVVNAQNSDRKVCFDDVVFMIKLFKINNTLSPPLFSSADKENISKVIVNYITTKIMSDIMLNSEEMILIYKDLDRLPLDNESVIQLKKVSDLVFTDENGTYCKKIQALFIKKCIAAIHENPETLSINDFLQDIEKLEATDSMSIESKGKLINLYYETSCNIIKVIMSFKTLEKSPPMKDHLTEEINVKKLLSFFENALDSGCLYSVLVITSEILKTNQIIGKKDLNILLNRIWNDIEELKTNNECAKCLKHFLELIDSLMFYNNYDDAYYQIISPYFNKILNYITIKNIPLYYYIVANELGGSINDCIDLVCEILMYNPVPKRDQRTYDNTPIFTHTIQKSAISALTEMYKNENLDMIAVTITNKINQLFKSKTRYHGNSQHHRTLLIGLQCLLTIRILNSESKESDNVVQWMIELLGKLPHQPSVKFCMEWYIALHYYIEKRELDNELVTLLQSRNVPHVSQLSILYLSLMRKNKNNWSKQENEFVMNIILSHTMGQTFNVRLHAQYLALRIFCKSKMDDKYNFIIEIIKRTLDENGSDKNLIKLQNDYFINEFDIVSNLTAMFIYYFIPVYYKVGVNEIIQTIFNISFFPYGVDLGNEFVAEWHKSCVSDEYVVKIAEKYLKSNTSETNAKQENEDPTGTIQKKYVPWKNMTDINVCETGKKSANASELIVVASLIDKLPNLGGMSRTSEVFGVNTYVVDNLSHLQDRQFQGLSVSAERWVNIEEVRPGAPLKQYLMKKKAEGYTLIAAEQTSTSCKLHQFKFPKYTLLLLGHEKEGVPCDLLPLMDHCVEIPQQGYVRSLNVHVTAAIFIWEYSRQNVLQVQNNN